MFKEALLVVSRKKSSLMGIAILFIMLYHSAVVLHVPYFEILFENFDIGVEIFAVLSGIGCYYSLSKDSRCYNFWSKRAKRLLPSFWLITGLYSLYFILLGESSIIHAVALVSGAATILGDFTFWFVTYIAICYIICPAVYCLLKDRKTYFSVSIVTFALVHVFFMITGEKVEWLQWMYRFADFILGMELASSFNLPHISSTNNEVSSTTKGGSGLCIIAIIFFLSLFRTATYEVKYLGYIISVIPLIISLSYLVYDTGILGRAISFLGSITLEIYLLHEHICMPIASYLSDNKAIICIYSIILAILFAAIFSKTLSRLKE